VFAYLGTLFRRARSIVEDDDPFGGANVVGHNEANTEIEFARTSIDLGEKISASHLAMTQDQIHQKEGNMAYSKPD
jgi:hypothetical protein